MPLLVRTAHSGRPKRELKDEMSPNISTSPPHLIAFLMSASGRFVVCRGCHLRFAFPFGAHFDLIAKQFESHLCGFQCLSNDDALSPNTPHLMTRIDRK